MRSSCCDTTLMSTKREILSNLMCHYRLDLMSEGVMISEYILIFVLLIITLMLFSPSLLPCYVFAAASPSFVHQEIRDPFRDIIDIKCLKDLPKGIDANKCEHTHEGNQSTDIIAVDYFSNGRFLNATIWLVSNINESA